MGRVFYKNNPQSRIWRVTDSKGLGSILFSFDKKKVYDFFQDYPQELSEEEKNIFDNEYPVLARLKA